MKKFMLSREEFNEFSFGPFGNRPSGSRYFHLKGEPYKLLAYCSSKLEDGALVSELGTYQGYGAYALSFNPKVKVVTYDITPSVAPEVANVFNIEHVIGDYREHWDEIVSNSFLIYVDIDHTGKDETRIANELLSKGPRIVIFDDVHLNSDMEKLLKIPDMVDITEQGHLTGTAILPIGIDYSIFGIEPKTKKDITPANIKAVTKEIADSEVTKETQ